MIRTYAVDITNESTDGFGRKVNTTFARCSCGEVKSFQGRRRVQEARDFIPGHQREHAIANGSM